MSVINVPTTVDIHTSATEAWQVFGQQFGAWADWAPGIDRSTLEGPLAEGVVRVNETTDLGTVRQHLVRFDGDKRALAYEMRDTLPPFFSLVRNDWTLVPNGPDHCRLVGDATFELREHAEPMRSKLEGKMGMSLEVFAKAFRAHMEDRASA